MSFSVYPYSGDQLQELFANFSGGAGGAVKDKLHLGFLKTYFETIKCLTIIAEHHYLDRDYSRDYCGYYVHCFKPPKKFCTRLHFFTNGYDSNEFQKVLCSKSELGLVKKLQDSYCGFIVVRPLPRMIGRTCLKPCPDNGKSQYDPYLITREYKISLYGIPLAIKTLAFQEQDKETAACATSAIWSVLHKTGCLFHHEILSPIEITKAATSPQPPIGAIFPNRGLYPYEAANAIRSVGLEPLFIDDFVRYENDKTQENGKEALREILYAYLRAEVPVLLGVELVNRYKNARRKDEKSMGWHALAVTGYSLGGAVPVEANFRLLSSRIDKLYAHDDQVGPFAPFPIKDGEYKWIGKSGDKKARIVSLHTLWKGERIEDRDTVEDQNDTVRAVPMVAIIPLYFKIRVAYNIVRKIVYDFNEVIKLLWQGQSIYTRLTQGWYIPDPSQLEWDIFLNRVSTLKESLRQSDLPMHSLTTILSESMPRFVWRARGLYEGKPLIELVFDATDIEQGSPFLRGIVYDIFLDRTLTKVSGNKGLSGRCSPQALEILNWFQEHKKTKNNHHEEEK